MTQATELPYLNPDLPVSQRVADLVSRLTLEEKVSQMVHHVLASSQHAGVRLSTPWR
jgi:hypothetical protein